MQGMKLQTVVADKVSNMLDKTLENKANSASCILWYEPKAPKALSRYRKDK